MKSLTPTASLISVVLLSINLSFGQSADRLARQAKEYADQGNFAGAVVYYSRALEAESRPRRKADLEKTLSEVKKRRYLQIFEEAEQKEGRREEITLHTQLRLLNIEDEVKSGGGLLSLFGRNLEKDFRTAVEAAQARRVELLQALAQEATELVNEQRTQEAISIYEVAEQLDPDQYVKQQVVDRHQELQSRLALGAQRIEEALELIEAKRYREAEEKLVQAQTNFAGKATDAPRQRIREAERTYRENKTAGDEAFERGEFGEARRKYETAQTIHPELSESDQLDELIAECMRRFRVEDSLRASQNALAQGDWRAAQELVQQVLNLTPDNTQAQSVLSEASSNLLLEQAKEAASSADYDLSENLLEQTLVEDPENEEASGLLERSREYQQLVQTGRAQLRAGRNEEARRTLLQARTRNPARFRADKLSSLIDRLVPENPLPFDRIRAGLAALVQGKLETAIEQLRAVLEEAGDGYIDLHAYLGAAYCAASLAARPEEDDPSLMAAAREQFLIVLDLEPDYTLSERLFSPRIIEILESVRQEVGQ